jgi:hypothetical protein
VIEAEHGLGPGRGRIQVERPDRRRAGLAGLAPHGLAAGELDRPWIAEAAHAGERPEVMVEGAVLLHQDHHVLDVLDRAGDAVGGRASAWAMAGVSAAEPSAAPAASLRKSLRSPCSSVMVRSPLWRP